MALAFPFYMKGYTASAVFTTNQCPAVHPPRNSPTAARLGVLVRAAHAASWAELLAAPAPRRRY